MEIKGKNEVLSGGIWIEEINNAVHKEFEKYQSAFKSGFVKIMPHAAVFPRCFASYVKQIQDFMKSMEHVSHVTLVVLHVTEVQTINAQHVRQTVNE